MVSDSEVNIGGVSVMTDSPALRTYQVPEGQPKALSLEGCALTCGADTPFDFAQGRLCPRLDSTRQLKVRKIPPGTGTWNPTFRKATKVALEYLLVTSLQLCFDKLDVMFLGFLNFALIVEALRYLNSVNVLWVYAYRENGR